MTTTETWLRIALYEIADAESDRLVVALEFMSSRLQDVANVLARRRGFQRVYYGVDLDEGKVVAVSHWSNLEAIEEAQADLHRLHAEADEHGIQLVQVQNIQVFPQAALAWMWVRANAADDAISPRIEAQSWLRVVTYKVEADDERARNYMVRSIEEFLQVLEKQPGFRRGCWGHDRAAGTMVAVTYWDNRTAILAAGPALARLQMKAVSNRIRPVNVRNIHLFAVPP